LETMSSEKYRTASSRNMQRHHRSIRKRSMSRLLNTTESTTPFPNFLTGAETAFVPYRHKDNFGASVWPFSA
jgi:hypothetical protein